MKKTRHSLSVILMTLGIILFWSGLGRGGEWTHNQEEWNLDVGITAGGSNLVIFAHQCHPRASIQYVFKSGSEVSFTIVPQPNEFIKAFEYQVEIEKVVVRDEFLNEIDPSVIGVSYSENKLDCHSNSVGLIVDPAPPFSWSAGSISVYLWFVGYIMKKSHLKSLPPWVCGY